MVHVLTHFKQVGQRRYLDKVEAQLSSDVRVCPSLVLYMHQSAGLSELNCANLSISLLQANRSMTDFIMAQTAMCKSWTRELTTQRLSYVQLTPITLPQGPLSPEGCRNG